MSEESVLVEKGKLSYSMAEAAAATGYSTKTLRIAIRRHDLIARYANSKPVILADELLDWLKSLPTEPKSGHAPLSQLVEDEPGWPGPPEREPMTSVSKPVQPITALFRTPEEVAPELGMRPTELRRYCKESGHWTKLSMRRMMLDTDNIKAIIDWLREQQGKVDLQLADPDVGHFK